MIKLQNNPKVGNLLEEEEKTPLSKLSIVIAFAVFQI